MALEFYATTLFSDANLKAYYRLEDANDASPNANHLTNTNVTFGTGKFNNGAAFNASGDMLRIASTLGITSGDISMGGWFNLGANPSSGTAWGLFIHHGGNVASGLLQCYYQNNAGTPRLVINNGTGNNYNVDISGGFHHIFVKRTSGVTHLFVDGVDVMTTGTNVFNPNASNLIIGNTSSSATEGIQNGTIDDFVVFNRYLTDAEIIDIYQGGAAALTTNYLTNYRPRKRTPGAVSV